MPDREKLTELLRSAMLIDTEAGIYEATVVEIADYLLANGVTVQQWIPVTERMPDCFQNVLTYEANRRTIQETYLTRHNEWANVLISGNVTHWMPLPEPPQEGEP